MCSKQTRKRFGKRKFFRKIIESVRICSGTDERPYAKIQILDESFLGLLDSGASVSVLGKNCLKFLEKHNILIKPFRSSISTADGSSQNIVGFCNLPVLYKNVIRNVEFYIVPTLKQVVYLGINFWKTFAIAPDIFAVDEIYIPNSNEEHYHELTSEQKLDLQITISEFPAFSKKGLGCTNILEHRIDNGDTDTIK